jgi:Reverse transcriptase (RNA-dependent DNA polymerase)
MVAPRQRYTTRSVTLIDPIDAILFTAFAIQLAPKLHGARQASCGHLIFSSAYSASLADQLYDPRQDYRSYRTALDTCLRKAKYVATADINDFYPRIYLHRLENALDSLLKDNLVTRVVMRFFNAWASGTSYGIPVGPHVSNLFAEATLCEVDTFLESNGVGFLRYVDDYVFFGGTESQCLKALFLLGSRLQETQGLSLNSAKTRVWIKKDFKSKIDLQDRPDAKLRKTIIDKVFDGDPYAEVDYEDLEPSQKRLVNRLNIEAILESSLSEEGLTDFSSVKFILNLLSVMSRPELTQVVLNNLARLHPVSHAVARFFRAFDEVDSADRHSIGRQLLSFVRGVEYVPDFQAMWLLEPFTHSTKWNNLDGVRRLAQDHPNRLVRRQAILALGQLADRSALLDVKAKLNDCSDWEQRAIVYACRALPEDEKAAFLGTVRVPRDWKLDTLLLKAVVEFAK